MTSPATLESSSPMDIDQHELLVQESMLKRQVAILEEFLRNDGHESVAVEDRCRILRRKVDLLEDEIALSGRSVTASRYLDSAPASHFVTVTRDQFTEWLRPQSSSQSTQGMSKTQYRLPIAISPKIHHERPMSNHDVHTHQAKKIKLITNDKSPCLRCKILKKRCDTFEECSHCPAQSYDSAGDYWRVLGCFRGCLRELSLIFCPEYSRATQRQVNYRQGGVDVINFVLTKSRVSEQKKRRMLHLIQNSEDFSSLKDVSWSDSDIRQSLSRQAITMDAYMGEYLAGDIENVEDHEAAWSVLQAVSMDPTYLKPTAYNMFKMLALGNALSKLQPAPWEIFIKAKKLLRQSVELYLLERLCSQIAAGEITSPPFDPLRDTPNTLVLVDLKEDFETLLTSFEKICIGRAKLTGYTQLACFYALLVLSVTKSLLTDAYSLRAAYENIESWNPNDSTRIASAFKVMVGIFCWSSRFDVVLQEGTGNDPEWLNALKDTGSMAQSNLWAERGIKGSKDFLLSLGSCCYSDGSYSGFFVQKFGLHTLSTYAHKPKEPGRPVSRHSQAESIADGHAATVSPRGHSRNLSSGTGDILTWVSQTQSFPDRNNQSHPSAPPVPIIFVEQNHDDRQASKGKRSRT